MTIDSKIFERLVDCVKDYAVFVIDPGGNVMTWNSGAQILEGYAAEEIIGRHFSIFHTDEAIRTGWPEYELNTATVDGRFEDEGWRVRQDGSRFWANVIITALRDETGRLLGFSKITRDLTNRRTAEETLRQSEERLRLLIEGVVDYAVYMIDPEGIIITWNTGAQRIKGYTRDEVMGRHFSQFYLPEDISAGTPWQELVSARNLGHLEAEGWRIRKDGEKFWGRSVFNALYDADGRMRGFAKVTQDLTLREHARELEQATRHVTEFIAVLAHELRNPLAPIRNATQVIRRMPGSERARDALCATIDRQTSHLTRIVDEMLDITRITRGTLVLQCEDVDIAEVVTRAVELVTPQVEQFRHTLAVEIQQDELGVSGDSDRLVQLLSNLLVNAVRFTPPGGQISLKAGRDDTQVIVSVCDTGRGIASDELPGIFGMFIQGQEPVNRVGGGLGVGLALSRRITELHHGTIEAHSGGIDTGSEFIVRLPAMAAPVTGNASSFLGHLQDQAAPSKRILVVDDNVDAASTLELLLQALGHSTCMANDGPTALDMADEFRPDIVLLDIGMPGMNGYEVARKLRQRSRRRVKIVAITGWGTEADKMRSADAGFDVHLVKPVDEAELQRILVANGLTKH